MSVYSLADTARILRIEPARLRSWERMELVRRRSDASGEPAFAFGDLVHLRTLQGLIERGVSMARIRKSLARIRERWPELEPLAALRACEEARGRVALRHEGALVEPSGQLVLEFGAPAPEALPVAAIAPAPAGEEGDGPPDTPLAWFERGCELDGRPGTLEEAAAAYRRALELDRGFADAWCNLGTVHFNRGERREACDAYGEALAIDPRHLEANFNLGNLLEEEGRREAALQHYRLAAEIDPFFPDGQLNLALLYEKLELRRKARAHWRRYLQLVPEGTWADVARQRLGEAPEPG